MEPNVRITVQRHTAVLPTKVTGQDEQGRITIICPQCGAPGYVELDGRVVCEDWAPIQAILTSPQLLADLEAAAGL